MITVAEAIRAWRKRRGLSQQALGEKAGTSSNMIGLYERGRSSPTVQQLERIAAAMNLELIQLLAGPDSKGSEVAEPGREYAAPRAVAKLCTAAFVEAWTGGPIDIESAARWPVLCDLLPHDGCLVTRISDDSMQPYLLEGDAVVIDPEYQGVASGNLVMVDIDGEVHARRYLDLGEKAIFEPYNRLFPPHEADLEKVLGLVVAVVERSLVGAARFS